MKTGKKGIGKHELFVLNDANGNVTEVSRSAEKFNTELCGYRREIVGRK